MLSERKTTTSGRTFIHLVNWATISLLIEAMPQIAGQLGQLWIVAGQHMGVLPPRAVVLLGPNGS